MPCIAYDWKVVLKAVQYVCHSAGLHSSDVITIPWYCDQWTSETAHHSSTLPARTKISDVDELKGLIKNEYTLFIERPVGDVVPSSTLEADISSIWCTDDVTFYTFDDFWDNSYSMIHWNVHVSNAMQLNQLTSYLRLLALFNVYINMQP